MTQRFKGVQDALAAEGSGIDPNEVRLVSITVDPAYDSPAILNEYAGNWGADLQKWHFLTGPATETLDLIREGFKITTSREGSGSQAQLAMPDMVHSTLFLLVDRQGWVRKIYHLDDENFSSEVMDGIEALLAES
jgi:cytochrome oxidase Cu insertion factor (SCO1/SenC/PrrC family)